MPLCWALGDMLDWAEGTFLFLASALLLLPFLFRSLCCSVAWQSWLGGGGWGTPIQWWQRLPPSSPDRGYPHPPHIRTGWGYLPCYDWMGEPPCHDWMWVPPGQPDGPPVGQGGYPPPISQMRYPPLTTGVDRLKIIPSLILRMQAVKKWLIFKLTIIVTPPLIKEIRLVWVTTLDWFAWNMSTLNLMAKRCNLYPDKRLTDTNILEALNKKIMDITTSQLLEPKVKEEDTRICAPAPRNPEFARHWKG